VLALLVANAGRLVTRDELRDAIWPNVHVDFDRGLNYCLRRIRIALGDDARAARFVETIPRQGYRFIAAVSVTRPTPRPRSFTVRRVAAAVVAAAIVGGAIAAETGGRNESHHRIALQLVKAVHDTLF
jgi:DNA-binding winged helix-turn-helix (wHTH) protein